MCRKYTARKYTIDIATTGKRLPVCGVLTGCPVVWKDERGNDTLQRTGNEGD